MILCKTLGKLFGHQRDASAAAAAGAAAAVFALCHLPLATVGNTTYEMRQQAGTATTATTTNGNGREGRSILAKNATATNYVNYAFGWRMRLHKFCSCQHGRQHDSRIGYRVLAGSERGRCVWSVECGAWSLPHISCLTNCIRVFNMRPTGALMLMCKGCEGLFHVMRKFYSCRSVSVCVSVCTSVCVFAPCCVII